MPWGIFGYAVVCLQYAAALSADYYPQPPLDGSQLYAESVKSCLCSGSNIKFWDNLLMLH